MGAKSSTEFGQIYVNFDKPSYFQGEYVFGTVSLNLLKDFPGNELVIKIKGKEEARWSEGSGKNRSSYSGKKIILSHQFPLYKFTSSNIPMGQYNFPFTVFMSPMLPATFKNVGTAASVSYKIKGEIKPTDKGYKHFRSSKDLHLKQAKNENFAPLISHLKVPVDIFCCFGQGTTAIQTQVNKTNFFEGETAYIDCSVDNSQCDLPLTTVELQLVRRLTLKSNGGHVHVISFVICSKINRLSLPAKSVSTAQTKFEVLVKHTALGCNLPSTSQGDIVKNCYFLTIYPRYESFLCNCCTKNVETPVLIYEPKDADLQQVQAPENWNPQVMPEQKFDWKSAQTYQGRNTGGFDYPKFDQAYMAQQYMPPNNPAAFEFNQPGNYQGMNNNNNQGMYNQPPNPQYNQGNYNQPPPNPHYDQGNFNQPPNPQYNQGMQPPTNPPYN